MAIQNRRGSYKDFNPNKLQPGEWATVLNGDPNAKDGKSTYLGYGDGIVKRMATYEDMQENIDKVTNEIVTELTTEVNKATSSANAATTKANEATQKANASASKADTATNNANIAISNANTATSKANTSASKANTSATNAQKIADTVQQKLDNGELKGEPGDIKNMDVQPLTFTEATNNDPIKSGETLKIILGKEKKLHSRVTKLETDINGKANSSHTHPSSNIAIAQSTIDAYKSMGMA